MKEKKQKENERKFKNWNETSDGGRIYTRNIKGRFGWYAEYIKKVDAEGNTIEFTQKFLTKIII